MNNGNKPHPIATLAEICFRLGTLFAGVGCLVIGYSALAGATPDNMTLMSYKIWGLQIAFSGSLYMVIAPIVRYTYMNYLWRHHFILMPIGFFILLRTQGSLDEINMFNRPMTLIIAATPLIFALIAKRKVRAKAQ